MDMIPVSSSNIAAIGWEVEDDEPCFCDASPTGDEHHHGTLAVDFKNGRTYHYFEVPESVFEELKGAPSIGRAFADLVRGGGYEFEQQ